MINVDTVSSSSELSASFETSARFEDGLCDVDWGRMPPRKPYRVFLALPNAGAIMPCALQSVTQVSLKRYPIAVQPLQFGDIEHNFNMMLCSALNARKAQGLTHFAMIHSDIGAQIGWLDVLLEEMDRVNADVMTTIVPIKDIRGLTTTGIRYPGVWGTKRFTMREIQRFPATFDISGTDEPDQILAINTGLWVARIPVGGWADHFPGFTCKHAIRCQNGEYQADFDSEDWLFSDWLHENKYRVFATRKVLCFHRGGNDFENQGTWGLWDTDQHRPRGPLNQSLAPAAIAQVVYEAPIDAQAG